MCQIPVCSRSLKLTYTHVAGFNKKYSKVGILIFDRNEYTDIILMFISTFFIYYTVRLKKINVTPMHEPFPS